MITNSTIRRIVSITYCAIILLLAVGFMASPKKEFSENENRYLAKEPVLSVKNLVSGTYMESMSEWLSDQFPMRDFFMGFKSTVEIGTGKREINGVYVAQEDYLIEAYAQPVNTQRIGETFRNFYEKTDSSQIDMRLMLIPTAITIYRDKLPSGAPFRSQMDVAQEIYQTAKIPSIDCIEQLIQGAESGQLYYRTDHHWTMYGAYQGYLAYCEAKGLSPVPLESWSAQTVTEEFAGTLYSKVNDYSHPKDSITIYTNPNDRLTVTYVDTGEVTDSLYNLDYLAQKDKYSLFLNNIHTCVEIENENVESDAVLVVIKDSYANSIIPFLAHHYHKIYVFDTRYYKEGPSHFLSEHAEVTDVLLLYNMNTIDTDSGIRGIY